MLPIPEHTATSYMYMHHIITIGEQFIITNVKDGIQHDIISETFCSSCEYKDKPHMHIIVRDSNKLR